MAKKKKKSPLLVIVIVVLAFFLLKDKISIGGSKDACGTRGADPDRSGYCLVTSSDYDELIIITGNTQNSPEPNLDFSEGELGDILSGVFYGDGQVNIISAAGSNLSINMKRSYKPAKNLNASKNNLKKLANDINESIKTSPEEPGADYFGAILKASNEISAKAPRHPIIVVTGSGYSDRGVLDFAHNDILSNYSQNNDINAIIAGDKSVVPDSLRGVTVRWYNAGLVAVPQESISDHYQAITRSLYGDLFSYLGATSKILGDTGSTSLSSVQSGYTVGQVYVEKLKKGQKFSVNEEVGRFRPDASELLNHDDVKDKLRSFARQFDNNGNLRLRLTGYIAFCSTSSELSVARAEAIKSILIELGVSSDKIDVYGRPGAPSSNPNEEYSCNSDLPETERRTVMIEVIEG